MKSFRTLDLAIEFHKKVTEIKITGHLKDQLFRAATSIPLNLGEGNAKRTEKEKKRYYHTAYASCHECKIILELAGLKGDPIYNEVDKLGAWLYNLLNSKISTIPFRDP